MPLDIKVMTRNLYLGADLQAVITAALTNRDAVPKEAAGAFARIMAGNFPARADCLAAEIAAHRPHVVGLQEAFIVRRRKPSSLTVPPFKEEPADDIVVDFAQSLIGSLAARGLTYVSAVATLGNDNQIPAGTPPALEDVRVTDREVILIDGGLAARGFELTDAGAHTFAAKTAYGPFQDIRTWAHVDLVAGGRRLRIVSTHLQPLVTDSSAALQLQQAEELVGAHAGRRDPMIVIGDFNAQAQGGTAATYASFVNAGFKDAWVEAGQGPGLTCKPEELRDPARGFDQRIDYVMCRNGLTPVEAIVTGNDPANRTASGLWPSDHGGVVATLRLDA